MTGSPLGVFAVGQGDLYKRNIVQECFFCLGIVLASEISFMVADYCLEGSCFTASSYAFFKSRVKSMQLKEAFSLDKKNIQLLPLPIMFLWD